MLRVMQPGEGGAGVGVVVTQNYNYVIKLLSDLIKLLIRLNCSSFAFCQHSLIILTNRQVFLFVVRNTDHILKYLFFNTFPSDVCE